MKEKFKGLIINVKCPNCRAKICNCNIGTHVIIKCTNCRQLVEIITDELGTLTNKI